MSIQLLSIPEAATALSVSRATVYRLIERGELPTVDMATGRGLRGKSKSRIRSDALDDFIVSRDRSATSLRASKRATA